jgi:phosphatidylglycerol:prolipoprotein diacylglycerol transferase
MRAGNRIVYPSLQIGHVLVPVFSVMLGVGIILFLLVTLVRSERYGLDKSVAGGAIIAGLAACIAGILTAKWMLNGTVQMRVSSAEAAMGWIAAVIGAIVWAFARRADVRRLADCLAPPSALFLAIMGIASFMAGCDYGKPTDSPLGVTFTNGVALAWYGTPLGIPLQPTQLYETILAMGMIAFLAVWERRRFPAGALFLTFCATYAVGRFILEFLRGDADRGFLWLLSIPQWLCLATLVVCAVSFFYAYGWRPLHGMRSHLSGLLHLRHSTQPH